MLLAFLINLTPIDKKCWKRPMIFEGMEEKLDNKCEIFGGFNGWDC